jgi:metallophosphoesterase (TIGR00282 family)
MRIVFIGDIVGEPGRTCLKQAAGEIRERWTPDFLVINGENAAGGSGLTPRLAYELMRSKVDVITLGDHAFDQYEIRDFFDEEPRVIRPFNYPESAPGSGQVVVAGNGLQLGVINAMGNTFMKPDLANPFLGIDAIIEDVRRETPCILLDFHAEATSEKIGMAYAVDGKVSAIVGTHTHVQTADERILPQGTAAITDVGFCGAHDSIIGREVDVILERYRTQLPVRMPLARGGLQADGVVVDIDESTGKALSIERLQIPVAALEDEEAGTPTGEKADE